MRRTAAILVCCATAACATEVTRTHVRCQTFFGTASPYDVATHTTTINTVSPDITIGFTTTPTSTLSKGDAVTINKTVTSVSTVITTVTLPLTSDVWTTTSTRLILRPKFKNTTFTHYVKTISYEPYTVTLQVPSPDGFLVINETARAPAPASTTELSSPPTVTAIPGAALPASESATPVTALPSASLSEQTVYVWQDGRLTPMPMSAIRDLLPQSSTATSGSATQVSAMITTSSTAETSMTAPIVADSDRWTDEKPAEDAPLLQHLKAAIVSPISSQVTDSHRTIPSIEESTSTQDDITSTIESVTPTSKPPNLEEYEEEDIPEEPLETESESATSRPTGTLVILTDKPRKTLQPVDMKTVSRQSPSERSDELHRRDSTKSHIIIKGLRGALLNDPNHKAPSYPTLVTCTKLYVRERTVWQPATDVPKFVTQATRINMVTTVSMLTLTTFVPEQSAQRTASFVTNLVITTTSHHQHTETQTDIRVYTSTTTKTALEACQTHNIYGPIGANDSHIINVYNRGFEKFTAYNIGYSRDPEACCVECHTMDTPCLGSVFASGQCLLLTDVGSRCASQGTGAGFFVARAAGEQPHRRRKWPDFTISNGPCGFFYDGGIGW